MKSLFNRILSEIVNGYDYKLLNKNIHSMFPEDPLDYFINNYFKIIDYIKQDDGFKVRVPITSTQQMLELSKTLPFFCDNVIFSPSPLWPSCHYELEAPWAELCDHSSGMIRPKIGEGRGIFYWDTSFIYGLATLKPLIEKENVTFLPQCGKSLHMWDCPELNLPTLPNPYLEGEITTKNIVEQAFYQLYMDNIVSDKLNCLHLMPNSCIDRISIKGTPSWNITLNKPASYALLKLKIPYIRNLSYEEIATIKEEEYDHFKSFRDGIRFALDEMSKEIEATSDLNSQVSKIQRDLIDEPLKELESRLTRLTKYQTYRMAGYTLASTSMLLSSLLDNDVFKISTQAIGTISILKVFDSYIDYLEKESELKSNSIFYLLRAKQLGKGRKKN